MYVYVDVLDFVSFNCWTPEKVTIPNTFISLRTKKLAKQAAAEAALKSIVQFRNPLEAQVRVCSM